ncbi:MAG TPA: fibronectin type III domain-containing protein [Polyangiaceae bacterium]|nr:fibronectin type III domain-containing protein [Polyangiaceae bacterium]
MAILAQKLAAKSRGAAVVAAALLCAAPLSAEADRRPPTAPVLSVTETGTTHVSLRWTPSNDDSPYIFYQVFVNGSASVWAGANTSATVTGLVSATAYLFTVRARDNGINWSASSNAVSATTKPSTKGSDNLAPTTPGNLSGFDGGCGEAWLRWDPSTDNVDPPLVIRYDVYVNGILRPESTVTGGTSTVAYAAVEGANTFELYAVDTAGNRSVPATVHMELIGLCQ